MEQASKPDPNGLREVFFGSTEGLIKQVPGLVVIEDKCAAIAIPVADATNSQSDKTVVDCAEIDSSSDSNPSDRQLKLVYEQEDRMSSYSMLLSSTSESKSRPHWGETSVVTNLINDNSAIPSLCQETPRNTPSLKPAIKPKVLFPQSELKRNAEEVDPTITAACMDWRKMENFGKQQTQVNPEVLDVDTFIKRNFKHMNDDYFGEIEYEPLFPEIENPGSNKLHSVPRSYSSQLPILSTSRVKPTAHFSPSFIHRIIKVDKNIGDIFSSQLEQKFESGKDDGKYPCYIKFKGSVSDVSPTISTIVNTFSPDKQNLCESVAEPEHVLAPVETMSEVPWMDSLQLNTLATDTTSICKHCTTNLLNTNTISEMPTGNRKANYVGASKIPYPNFMFPKSRILNDVSKSTKRLALAEDAMWDRENLRSNTFDANMIKYEAEKKQSMNQHQLQGKGNPSPFLNLNESGQRKRLALSCTTTVPHRSTSTSFRSRLPGLYIHPPIPVSRKESQVSKSLIRKATTSNPK